MNKIILIGRLTKDPELNYTNSGKAVCKFTLAVNRPYSNQDGKSQADFINIVVWNKPAENSANYLAKGRQCAVEGRLQIRSYEADDGTRKYITEVVANSVQFLSSSKSDEKSSTPSDIGEEVYFSDQDLPF